VEHENKQPLVLKVSGGTKTKRTAFTKKDTRKQNSAKQINQRDKDARTVLSKTPGRDPESPDYQYPRE